MLGNEVLLVVGSERELQAALRAFEGLLKVLSAHMLKNRLLGVPHDIAAVGACEVLLKRFLGLRLEFNLLQPAPPQPRSYYIPL